MKTTKENLKECLLDHLTGIRNDIDISDRLKLLDQMSEDGVNNKQNFSFHTFKFETGYKRQPCLNLYGNIDEINEFKHGNDLFYLNTEMTEWDSKRFNYKKFLEHLINYYKNYSKIKLKVEYILVPCYKHPTYLFVKYKESKDVRNLAKNLIIRSKLNKGLGLMLEFLKQQPNYRIINSNPTEESIVNSIPYFLMDMDSYYDHLDIIKTQYKKFYYLKSVEEYVDLLLAHFDKGRIDRKYLKSIPTVTNIHTRKDIILTTK